MRNKVFTAGQARIQLARTRIELEKQRGKLREIQKSDTVTRFAPATYEEHEGTPRGLVE
jgi:hypothetical protein